MLRIFEYVFTYMIFDEKNASNKSVTNKILIEIHFVNDLKINLLIDIDVFEFQKMNIDFDNNVVYIKIYEMKTLINSHIKKTLTLNVLYASKKRSQIIQEQQTCLLHTMKIYQMIKTFYSSHIVQKI